MRFDRLASSFRHRLKSPTILAGSLVLALSAAVLPGADPAEEAPKTFALRILGSNTIGTALMGNIVQDFLKSEGWTDLRKITAPDGLSYAIVGHPKGSTTSTGVHVEYCDPDAAIAALSQGFADVAMSTRRVNDPEVARLAKLGDMRSPDCEHAIALDAIAVIVHPTNPIEALTRGQLKTLFTRKASSWEEFGAAGAIHLYARDAKSGTTQTFQTVILGNEEIAAETPRYGDNKALTDALVEDPRGIGFVALPYVGKARVLAISDGATPPKLVKPEAGAMRSAEYPLTRRLYLYTAAGPDAALAGKLARYAQSPAGEAAVTASGFVSLKAPEVAPVVTPTPVATPAPAPTPAAREEAPARQREVAPRTPRPKPRPVEREAAEPPKKAPPTPAPTPEVSPTKRPYKLWSN